MGLVADRAHGRKREIFRLVTFLNVAVLRLLALRRACRPPSTASSPSRPRLQHLQGLSTSIRQLFMSDKKGVLSIEDIVHYVIGHDVILKLDLVMDTALQYIRLSTACEGHPAHSLQTARRPCQTKT